MFKELWWKILAIKRLGPLFKELREARRAYYDHVLAIKDDLKIDAGFGRSQIRWEMCKELGRLEDKVDSAKYAIKVAVEESGLPVSMFPVLRDKSK